MFEDVYYYVPCPCCGIDVTIRYTVISYNGASGPGEPEIFDQPCSCLLGDDWLQDTQLDWLGTEYDDYDRRNW